MLFQKKSSHVKIDFIWFFATGIRQMYHHKTDFVFILCVTFFSVSNSIQFHRFQIAKLFADIFSQKNFKTNNFSLLLENKEKYLYRFPNLCRFSWKYGMYAFWFAYSNFNNSLHILNACVCIKNLWNALQQNLDKNVCYNIACSTYWDMFFHWTEILEAHGAFSFDVHCSLHNDNFTVLLLQSLRRK